MPDYIESRLNAGKEIGIFRHSGYWLDIGRIEDFNQAQIDIEYFKSDIQDS